MTAINSNRAIRGPVTAVPVVAGKGVRLTADTENNRIVAEADETVLWEGTITATDGSNFSTVITLSETVLNFDKIEVYCNGRINYLSWHPTSVNAMVAYKALPESNSIVVAAAIIQQADKTKIQYRCGFGNSFQSAYTGEYWSYGTPYKVIGINRVASA